MAKQEEKKTPASPPAPQPVAQPAVNAQYASKIDAIKDIIFGEDYAALRQSIKELDEKLEHRLTQLDDRLSAVIQDLDRTLRHKIDELEMDLKSEIDRVDHHKADRFKLGQALEALGRSLQE